MLWTATVVARADLFVLRINGESLQSLAAEYTRLSTLRSSRTRLAQHERVAHLPEPDLGDRAQTQQMSRPIVSASLKEESRPLLP
jgi:hypothetical protein